MFRSLSLNVKLLIPSVVLCGVIGTLGFVSWRALTNVSDKYDQVSSVSLPRVHMTDEVFLSFRRVRISLRTLGLPGLSEKAAEESIEDAIKEVGKVDELLKQYTKIPFETGEREKYESVKAAWSQFKVVGAHAVKAFRGHDTDRVATLSQIFLVDCPDNAKVMTAAIKDLVAFHDENASGWRKEASQASADARSLIVTMLSIGLFVGFILTFATLKSVSGLIKSIAKVVNSLDLTATKVGDVSDTVAQTSEKLSANSTQQASALQQTTSALEETSSMVLKNTESAKRSADVSQTTRTSAERGREAVGQVVDSMQEIAKSNASILHAVEESNREVSEIIKVINEIGSKTRVINDIVFQTKLLSFNASVEAARAGEHGKGFAVVAQEVGALAEMSGRSSKEISDLLDSSVTHVKSVVDKMKRNVEQLVQQGTQKVDSGAETAERCAVVLSEIVDQITEMNSMASDISASSQEQSKGIQEINSAVTQLDTAAQENAVASAQVSNSATELRHEVGELRSLIQGLDGLVKGGGPQAVSAAPITMKRAKGAAQSRARAA